MIAHPTSRSNGSLKTFRVLLWTIWITFSDHCRSERFIDLTSTERNPYLVMSNRMGEGVNVTTSSGEIVLNQSQSVSMARKDNLNVEIGGISYPFAADQNVTSFKLIFRTEDLNSNKEVYIYG